MLLLGAFFTYSCTSPVQKTVDKKATWETLSLYTNLVKIQGKSILFGHQDDTSYGIGWTGESGQSDVKKVTGDYPAVYGWDLGHIETGSPQNIDNVPFEQMRSHIIEAYERGGVNMLSWHVQNPFTGGSSWDVSSKEVVKSILPDGEKHALFLEWLDHVAAFIASLKTGNGTAVPVLFRPYHEHTGNWFWWGRELCEKDDYLALWHFTVTYLRDKKDLHNILYVYSPDFVTGEQEYFDRYPGDEFVDILGFDLYHRGAEDSAGKFISDVNKIMEFLSRYAAAHKKAFVFSETGLEQIPMNKWFTEVLYKAVAPYKPAYVLLWRNAYDRPEHFFVPYPAHPATDDFIKFKNLPDILFGNDLPNLYK